MSKFEFKRGKGFKVDEFFKDNFDTTGIDDNIYNQIAKDMARCIDIDLAKTPLVDILTGYTRYKEAEYELQQKENIIKEVREYVMTELITEWDIKNNGYVSGSDLPVDAITPILEILDKEK